jgi:hypothetical protein
LKTKRLNQRFLSIPNSLPDNRVIMRPESPNRSICGSKNGHHKPND